ncbi:MAG: hypothetical protein JWR34_5465 [Mycobacterium sp.]|nr:hypothetical protein [Mycobacterium sp.]
MPTSKSCATVAAIHKTSHSATHELSCGCRFSWPTPNQRHHSGFQRMQRVQERSARPLTPPPRLRRTRRTAPTPHRRRTHTHPVNVVTNVWSAGLQVWGSYAGALLIQTNYIPAGWVLVVASGGPNSDLNPVAVRQHVNHCVLGPQAYSRARPISARGQLLCPRVRRRCTPPQRRCLHPDHDK